MRNDGIFRDEFIGIHGDITAKDLCRMKMDFPIMKGILYVCMDTLSDCQLFEFLCCVTAFLFWILGPTISMSANSKSAINGLL